MLERKFSASSVADTGKGLSLPGERIIAFSELFEKLSRPEMLDGVRPASDSTSGSQGGDSRGMLKEKLVVVLVGLPARGKSYISHRLVNYLNWFGVRCKLFNVGAYRRKQLAEDKASRADFFSTQNKDAAQKREELAAQVFEQLLEWLRNGKGNVAIFDATNTTRERRKSVLLRAAKEAGVEMVFVESICTDEKVVEANLAEKVRLSPDFKGMDFHTAVKDLKTRIKNYEAIYETVEDDELNGKGEVISFIKVINLSSKVIANNIHGRVARCVLTFLMNLHIVQRPIFLVRAPDANGLMVEDRDVERIGLTMPGGVVKGRDIEKLQDESGAHGEQLNVDSGAYSLEADETVRGLGLLRGSSGSLEGSSGSLHKQSSGSLEHEAIPDAVGKRISVGHVPSHPDMSGMGQTQAMVMFEEEKSAVLELAGEVSVSLVRKYNMTGSVSVHYQTVDGSAQAGEHYQHASGVVTFAEGQSRADIRVTLQEVQNCTVPEESFYIVLSGAQPAGTVLGKKRQCTVTILTDDSGLPERLRRDWSRLRFPDVTKLSTGLHEGGKAMADRLSHLLTEQVQEHYMALHRQRVDKLRIAVDLAEAKLLALEEELQATALRQTAVEEAMRLQDRMIGSSPEDHVFKGNNFTSTLRLTGHLYNRHLLEKALDIIESKDGRVRSVGEPTMGGCSGVKSSIVLQVHCVREKADMKDIIQRIRLLFEEDSKEAAGSAVEVMEGTKDVGELGKLKAQIEDTKTKRRELEEDVANAKNALTEAENMSEKEVTELAQCQYPTHVFTSTLPICHETGSRLFGKDGVLEETSSLNMVDIGACHGMSLTEIYESMGKENVRQFLVSPYNARLPGGESLKDVVHRLEPFVVDHIERQRCPTVVVSHLSTLQVLYQYFVGATSKLPFWKLDIPRGSVIQLVPHLFGFEERRFSFRPDSGARKVDAAVHMASHWDQ